MSGLRLAVSTGGLTDSAGEAHLPELPDVEMFKRVLDRHALGRAVARAGVADPGILEGATAVDATSASC